MRFSSSSDPMPTRLRSRRVGPTPHAAATAARLFGPTYFVMAALETRVGSWGKLASTSSVASVPSRALPSVASGAFDVWSASWWRVKVRGCAEAGSEATPCQKEGWISACSSSGSGSARAGAACASRAESAASAESGGGVVEVYTSDSWCDDSAPGTKSSAASSASSVSACGRFWLMISRGMRARGETSDEVDAAVDSGRAVFTRVGQL